ncbi:hypothetical protein HDC90_001384 [Pedobacter sp. AK013]|uniref:hypothetical protein n=1 Tax=Pedobacter sp. AK013 TaxID=2723071 RepID=UPI001621D87E|nr:hypothetical protein [Pedobacter sp. AK013]MBB6236769.1 hypothetical protein [Pedobacter sp. AK013]
MKSTKIKTINGHIFHGKPHLKIKRIKVNSRHRIRQALRASLPFFKIRSQAQEEQ